MSDTLSSNELSADLQGSQLMSGLFWQVSNQVESHIAGLPQSDSSSFSRSIAGTPALLLSLASTVLFGGRVGRDLLVEINGI